jgi:Protein of unknown function (DUF2924)
MASASHAAARLDALIAGLAECDAGQLRLQWRNHLGGAPPAHLPRWLVLRLLAYPIQAMALGDLDRATLRLIRQSKGGDGDDAAAPRFAPRDPSTRGGVSLKTGALLAREWDGRMERVMILDKGFAWNGSTYGSLSQIAKAMTGTSWNGHRFFGLRPIGGRASRKSSRGQGSSRGESDPVADSPGAVHRSLDKRDDGVQGDPLRGRHEARGAQT